MATNAGGTVIATGLNGETIEIEISEKDTSEILISKLKERVPIHCGSVQVFTENQTPIGKGSLSQQGVKCGSSLSFVVGDEEDYLIQCSECKGSGKCSSCEGAGCTYDRDGGSNCSRCGGGGGWDERFSWGKRGDGKCHNCNATGKESFLQKRFSDLQKKACSMGVPNVYEAEDERALHYMIAAFHESKPTEESFLRACGTGDEEMVSRALSLGTHYINARSTYDWEGGPVQQAAENHHVGVLRLLLEAEADPNEGEHGYQTCPGIALLKAADDPHVVEVLLAARANPNAQILKSEDEPEESALHKAASVRNADVIKKLLEHKADVNIRSTPSIYNDTPLASILRYIKYEKDDDRTKSQRAAAVLKAAGGTTEGCAHLDADICDQWL